MQERTDTIASALWQAANTGDLLGIRRLLAEGVDVNIWDRYGRNALTWAATNGDLEMVELLLDAGAWIDPFDDNDEYLTPLMCAANSGHVEVVDLLLCRGADPTLHGWVPRVTAEYLARTDYPAIAARLQRAEDDWRRKNRSLPNQTDTTL